MLAISIAFVGCKEENLDPSTPKQGQSDLNLTPDVYTQSSGPTFKKLGFDMTVTSKNTLVLNQKNTVTLQSSQDWDGTLRVSLIHHDLPIAVTGPVITARGSRTWEISEFTPTQGGSWDVVLKLYQDNELKDLGVISLKVEGPAKLEEDLKIYHFLFPKKLVIGSIEFNGPKIVDRTPYEATLKFSEPVAEHFEVKTYADMVDMDHGQTIFLSSRLQTSEYKLSNVYFMMPGKWRIHVEVYDGDKLVDHVYVTIHVALSSKPNETEI